MSLISRLFAVRPRLERTPQEDFFTEAFAHLLERRPKILAAFLEHFVAIYVNELHPVAVRTQQTFPKLSGHHADSRIDLLVQSHSSDFIVFIESKIGAAEGQEQLARYRDHLFKQPEQRKILLYITNKFEKKKDVRSHTADGAFEFIQLRWHSVCRFLSRWRAEDELVADILVFMKEQGMTQKHQFSPMDLYSFQNWLDVISLLDAVLDRSMVQVMEAACGGTVQKDVDQRFSQLRKHRRYILYWFNQQELELLAGFWIDQAPSREATEYPSLALEVNVAPRNPQFRLVCEHLSDFSNNHPDWHFRVRPDGWATLRKEASMRKFLAEEDHVDACKAWLAFGLKEFESLRLSTTSIAWTGAAKNHVGAASGMQAESSMPNRQIISTGNSDTTESMHRAPKTTLVMRDGAELGVVADILPISDSRQSAILSLAQRAQNDAESVMICCLDDNVQSGDLVMFKSGFLSNQFGPQGFKVIDVFPIPSEENPNDPYTVAIVLEKKCSVSREG